MNSEELELSLRTEFESYLNDILSEMKQEVAEFQKKIEAELDKHKSQLDEAFQDFSSRLSADKRLDDAFRGSVMEHLRLARDEGAQITATAIAEAEAMEQERAISVNLNEIRDAINDISSQTSQSTILKSLVNHAEQFTPRGAFFIIRNEQFFGWQVFGRDIQSSEVSARDINFPVTSDTVLGEGVRVLRAVESGSSQHRDDGLFLDPLGFSHPERLFAVPLVARGRGVAVLYADGGADRGEVNVEALETLVRVASLTVELLASNQTVAKPQAEPVEEPVAKVEEETQRHFAETPVYEYQEPVNYEAEVAETPAEAFEQSESFEYIAPVESVEEVVYEEPEAEQEFQVVSEFDEAKPVEMESADTRESKPAVSQEFSYSETEPAPVSYSEPEAEDISYPEAEVAVAEENFTVQEEPAAVETTTHEFVESAPVETVETLSPESQTTEFAFESREEVETTRHEEVAAHEPAPSDFQPVSVSNGNGKVEAPEPVVEVATATPTRSRLSDRQVDLPIDVADDERRFHNDARRFARLLVSEIKLYNEQKVKDGREANDLYDRLREAIDRSREMYDKRVQPPVASKFDYFHYELVSALADGDEGRLGGSYPGSTI